jgi:hypothetical protein
MEAFAILLRRNTHQSLERAAHGFGAAEAAFFRDQFYRLGRFLEPAPRGFHPDL